MDQTTLSIVSAALRRLGYNDERTQAFGSWSHREIVSSVRLSCTQGQRCPTPKRVFEALSVLWSCKRTVLAIQMRVFDRSQDYFWVDRQAYEKYALQTEEQRRRARAVRLKTKRKAARTYGRLKSDVDAVSYRWPECPGQTTRVERDDWTTHARRYSTEVEEELDFEPSNSDATTCAELYKEDDDEAMLPHAHEQETADEAEVNAIGGDR